MNQAFLPCDRFACVSNSKKNKQVKTAGFGRHVSFYQRWVCWAPGLFDSVAISRLLSCPRHLPQGLPHHPSRLSVWTPRSTIPTISSTRSGFPCSCLKKKTQQQEQEVYRSSRNRRKRRRRTTTTTSTTSTPYMTPSFPPFKPASGMGSLPGLPLELGEVSERACTTRPATRALLFCMGDFGGSSEALERCRSLGGRRSGHHTTQRVFKRLRQRCVFAFKGSFLVFLDGFRWCVFIFMMFLLCSSGFQWCSSSSFGRQILKVELVFVDIGKCSLHPDSGFGRQK